MLLKNRTPKILGAAYLRVFTVLSLQYHTAP